MRRKNGNGGWERRGALLWLPEAMMVVYEGSSMGWEEALYSGFSPPSITWLLKGNNLSSGKEKAREG